MYYIALPPWEFAAFFLKSSRERKGIDWQPYWPAVCWKLARGAEDITQAKLCYSKYNSNFCVVGYVLLFNDLIPSAKSLQMVLTLSKVAHMLGRKIN